MPPPPAGPQRPFPTRPPGALNIAFVLTILVPVSAVVLLVIAALSAHGWLSDLADGTAPGIDVRSYEEEVALFRPYVYGVFVALTLISLALTLLWVGLGFKLRKGSRAARSTLTVLAVIWAAASVLLAIIAFFGGRMFAGFLAEGYDLRLPFAVMLPWYVQEIVVVIGLVGFFATAYAGSSTAYVKSVTPARAAKPGRPG